MKVYQVEITRNQWKALCIAIEEAKTLKGLYCGEERAEYEEMIREAEQALEAIRPKKT